MTEAELAVMRALSEAWEAWKKMPLTHAVQAQTPHFLASVQQAQRTVAACQGINEMRANHRGIYL